MRVQEYGDWSKISRTCLWPVLTFPSPKRSPAPLPPHLLPTQPDPKGSHFNTILLAPFSSLLPLICQSPTFYLLCFSWPAEHWASSIANVSQLTRPLMLLRILSFLSTSIPITFPISFPFYPVLCANGFSAHFAQRSMPRRAFREQNSVTPCPASVAC